MDNYDIPVINGNDIIQQNTYNYTTAQKQIKKIVNLNDMLKLPMEIKLSCVTNRLFITNNDFNNI